MTSWDDVFKDLEKDVSRLRGQRKLKKLAQLKKFRAELKTNSRMLMHRALKELDISSKELAMDMVNSEVGILTKLSKSFDFRFTVDKKSRLRTFIEAVDELRTNSEPITRHPKQGISMLIDQSHDVFQLVEDNLHLSDDELVDLFMKQENAFMEEWNEQDFGEKGAIIDLNNKLYRDRAYAIVQNIRESHEKRLSMNSDGLSELIDGYFEILERYEQQILDSDPENEEDLIEEMWIDYSLFIAQMDDPNIQFNPDNEGGQKSLLRDMFRQVREDGCVPDKENVLGALRSL